MIRNIEIHACSSEKSTMSYPAGALCVKAAINSNPTRRTTVFEHITSEDPAQSARICASRHPDAVGLSVYIWNSDWMLDFAEAIKSINPEITVFAGGPQVSAFEHSLPDCIDFAIQGEGETTVPEVLTLADEDKAEHRIYKAEIPDLSNLVSPLLSGQSDNILAGTDSMLWEMTRGCPFGCAFCFESRGNRTVRNYPLERIEQELEYIIIKEVQNVFVLDPTFNLNSGRAETILEMLLNRAPSYMHFTFEIRAELLTERQADLFAALNCSVQIGLQSSDEEVLKNVGRKFNKEEFCRKVRLLSDRGVAFGLDIIAGLPGDDLRKFRSTVDFAVSLMPSNIDCFSLALLPGTELRERQTELGIITYDDTEHTIKSSPTFSEEDLINANELRSSMDLFYTKGQADMWIHCILETLNISACNLFSLFGKWMRQTDRNEDEDIWLLQDDFVTSLFEKTSNGKLIPAIKSFMELHQGICYVTDTGEPAELELNYLPDDLALLDRMSLSEFVKTKKSRHIFTTLVMDDDGSVVFRNL